MEYEIFSSFRMFSINFDSGGVLLQVAVWLIYFVLFIFGFSYLGAFGPYVSPIAVAGQSFPYVPLGFVPHRRIRSS